MSDEYSGESLARIANAIEEILRLVKEDQERSRKYMEKQKDEQTARTTAAEDLNDPRGLAGGLRLSGATSSKLQASSDKLQATSGKLDKVQKQDYIRYRKRGINEY